MSDILCVTNRSLCRGDFLTRLEEIAAAHPAGIILREKDLSQGEYRCLAARVMELCRVHETPCILHTFVNAAIDLGASSIHLPLPVLRNLTKEQKARFSHIGASCHSPGEAREAEKLGCAYITAGHVFDTDCKRGLPGRGLSFLREVCEAVTIPVYAIGGIGPENIAAVRETGAAGGCVMSGLMQCPNPAAFLKNFQK
ncbi:MAG: thiamine phosphate synthase [Faecousia sp.]